VCKRSCLRQGKSTFYAAGALGEDFVGAVEKVIRRQFKITFTSLRKSRFK
jgi:hypothetical protein